MKLTKNETEIMEVLWQAKCPLSSAEIIKRSINKSWKESSIHIILNSLLKKEAIIEVGFVRSGKGYGRTFEPTVSGEKYYADLLVSMTTKTNATTLFSALFNSNKLTTESIQELEKMIIAKKRDLE